MDSDRLRNTETNHRSGLVMPCASCQAEIEVGQSFCDVCGATQPSRTCGACRATLDTGSDFCDACGARQGSAVPAGETRKGQALVSPPLASSGPRGDSGFAVSGNCISCGRDPGVGLACPACRQVTNMPAGISLSSPGTRFCGHFLDVILMFVTFGIGWLIWTIFFTARQGQTPAKQLMHMRVIKMQSGQAAGLGAMFARDVIYKFVIFLLITTVTCGLGLILYFWLLWDKNNQELWDKMAETYVVNDRDNRLVRS